LPEIARATSWGAEEQTPNGLARVRYEDDGDALRRVRQSYRGVPGLVGAGEGQQELSSTATIALDEHGSVQSIVDQESLRASDRTGAISSRWMFSAKRANSDSFDAKTVDLGELDEATGESQLERERQRGRDERLSQGWDLGSIEVQLEVYGNYAKGRRIDPKFVSQAAAYVRLHPESCPHLVAWFQQPRMTDLGKQLVLDVLSAAGSDEAQSAMRGALDTDAARDPKLRGALVQRFIFVTDPNPESARFVAGIYEGSRANGQTQVAYSAAAALGAIIGHMHGADALSEQLDQRLRDDLAERRSPEETEALVLALGNARQDPDLDAIAGFAQDEQPTVREQVARSLRWFDDPTSAGALLELARDAAPGVARAAFRSLRHESIDDGDWESLTRAVEEGQASARAYMSLVDLLEQRPDCGSDRTARMVHIVLDRTPDTSGNRELRERAARLLTDQDPPT
jgi:HEAT repeats